MLSENKKGLSAVYYIHETHTSIFCSFLKQVWAPDRYEVTFNQDRIDRIFKVTIPFKNSKHIYWFDYNYRGSSEPREIFHNENVLILRFVWRGVLNFGHVFFLLTENYVRCLVLCSYGISYETMSCALGRKMVFPELLVGTSMILLNYELVSANISITNFIENCIHTFKEDQRMG